jgi:hypothetical protein
MMHSFLNLGEDIQMKRYTTHYTLQRYHQFFTNDLLYLDGESCDVMISFADYFAPYRWNYGRWIATDFDFHFIQKHMQ